MRRAAALVTTRPSFDLRQREPGLGCEHIVEAHERVAHERGGGLDVVDADPPVLIGVEQVERRGIDVHASLVGIASATHSFWSRLVERRHVGPVAQADLIDTPGPEEVPAMRHRRRNVPRAC